ncbi:MAG: tetratricopeptide repeat protein [bacterium]
MPEHPTISLCMIVRDEEENLPRCLESVKGLVDEIIVVDTGSKDKTREIARSFGAKVYQHPWEDDFSKARNISLSYAASDWILVLDADEWLDRKYIPKIKKILKEAEEYVGVSFVIYSETATGMGTAHAFKLFKNHEGFYYEGAIHEQLIIHGKILTTKFRIYHSGYNLTPARAKKKFERSAKLLKDGIEEDPNNFYYRFHLGRLYLGQEMYQECIREALVALDISKTVKEVDEATILMIMFDLAYAYFELQDYRQAEEVCLKAMSMRPDYPDIILVLGYVYLKMGRREEEIATFKKFIEVVKQQEEEMPYDNLLVASAGSVDKAYQYIGEAFLKLSRLDEAIANFKLSLEHNPKNTKVYESLIRCYQETREADWIKETCLKALTNEVANALIYYLLGLIYKEEKNPEAKNFLQKVIELKPEGIPAYLDLVDIYFEEQEFEPVFPLLDKLRELEPKRAYRLYQAMGDKEAVRGDYEGAIRAYNIILANNPEDEGARTGLARCQIKLGQYEDAQRNYQTLLSVNPHHPEALRLLKLLEELSDRSN